MDGLQQILLLISVLLEWLLYFKPVWRLKRNILPLIGAIVFIASFLYLFKGAWYLDLLVLYLSIYRLVNLRRIYVDKIKPQYLFVTARRTSLILGASQLLLAILQVLIKNQHISLKPTTVVFSLILLVLNTAIFKTYLLNKHKISQRAETTETLDRSELPTLSVAIPARNETEDLIECLNSLLASNYPKLEIIVLDDCSQEKRTPEIVRDFAQKGIIFIAGEEPPESWLAKNYAYEQLCEASNGDFLLFCGVDTRFEPDSLDQLVGTALNDKLDMISLLPINARDSKLGVLPSIVQPLRYAWELIVPPSIRGRHPVLSTCWLISRKQLSKAGMFKGISRKVLPETYFARLSTKTNSYGFIAANDKVSIVSKKTGQEKLATAIRTRYPQLHRRIELSAAVSIVVFLIFLGPALIFLISLFSGNFIAALFCLISFALSSYTFSKIVDLTYRENRSSNLFLLVPAVVYDLWLLNYSMYCYEFKEVIWKGRNICVPVMQQRSNLGSNSGTLSKT